MSAEQNSQKARTSNAQVVQSSRKRGRITIPFEIRQRIGFKYNDVLSFTQQDDGSVVVRKEKSATTVMNLQKNSRKISPLKISLTACPRKNREMHFCIFLCCWQKNRMLVYRLRLPKRSDYQLVFKNLWTFEILWIYLLLKGQR